MYEQLGDVVISPYFDRVFVKTVLDTCHSIEEVRKAAKALKAHFATLVEQERDDF